MLVFFLWSIKRKDEDLKGQIQQMSCLWLKSIKAKYDIITNIKNLQGAIMAYVIRNGKLEKAHKIQNLTSAQKAVLKVSTRKQSDKLEELKKKMEELKAS